MELKELLSKFFTLKFPIKRKYYFLVSLVSLIVSLLLYGLAKMVTSMPNSIMTSDPAQAMESYMGSLYIVGPIFLIVGLLIIVVGFATEVGRLFDVSNNRKLSIGITIGAYIVGFIPVIGLLSTILYIALFFIPSGAINSESKK